MRIHAEKQPEIITVDVPTEKPLSDLINDIKELLRRYQSNISVSYNEKGGTVMDVEITARIQVRR
jgi:hypothetical protein